jgi:hypothetical protein
LKKSGPSLRIHQRSQSLPAFSDPRDLICASIILIARVPILDRLSLIQLYACHSIEATHERHKVTEILNGVQESGCCPLMLFHSQRWERPQQ